MRENCVSQAKVFEDGGRALCHALPPPLSAFSTLFMFSRVTIIIDGHRGAKRPWDPMRTYYVHITGGFLHLFAFFVMCGEVDELNSIMGASLICQTIVSENG